MSKLKTLDSKLIIPQSGLSPDQYLPYLIDIDVFEQAVSHVGWDGVLVDSDSLFNGYKYSNTLQDAEISFDVVLAAGTWDIELLIMTINTSGIYSIQIDGATVGTTDGYSSPSVVRNVSKLVSGVNISSTGKKRLTLKMATKNVASSRYDGYLHHIQLRRTDTPTGPVTTIANGDKLPWFIDINPFMTPISHINWPRSGIATSPNYIHNGRSASSGAQNAEISFDVILAAGTWTIEVMGGKNTSDGIMSVQIDGVEKGTIDQYSGSLSFNDKFSVTNIQTTVTGKRRLTFKMTTKNASSSGYFGVINHIQLRRTA